MDVFFFMVVFLYAMALLCVRGENTAIKEGLNIQKILLSGNESDTRYFKILKLNKNDSYLYVGAKNQVIRLNLMNINDTPSILHLVPSKADINECVKQGKKREPDCQNHVRVVELVGPNDLLVCGTGAYNPKQYRVKATSLTLYNDTTSTSDGKGVCPYDPFDRVVSLLSEDRNDSRNTMIYTGVYDDFLKTDPYILRQPLFFSTRAQQVPKIKTGTESDWLFRPHFVGGSDVGEEVLFFFREEGKYCLRPERQLFSLVAKVCKSDPGYYEMYWLSYQKTRLCCRMPGDHEDFYQIEDIAEVNDVFYALFTKSFEGMKASVVCSFTKNVILKSFLGNYQASCSNNGRVRSSAVAYSMSSSCDVFRNENHSFSSMYKKENFLMEQELKGSNVFYTKDILYTDIEVIFNRSGQNDTTIFAATNGGQIHEILVQFPPSNSNSRIYNIFNGTEEVRSLIYFKEQLYISSDSSVIQINIRCAKYGKCEDCRSDPNCTCCTSVGCKVSNQTSCLDGNKDASSDADVIRLKKVDIKTDLGSTSFLEINQTLPNSEVQWYFNSTPLSLNNPNLVLTKENNLIIKDTRHDNQGNYTAVEIMGKNAYKSEINLSVIDNSSVMRWEKAFNEWSEYFENAKTCSGNFKMQC